MQLKDAKAVCVNYMSKGQGEEIQQIFIVSSQRFDGICCISSGRFKGGSCKNWWPWVILGGFVVMMLEELVIKQPQNKHNSSAVLTETYWYDDLVCVKNGVKSKSNEIKKTKSDWWGLCCYFRENWSCHIRNGS